MVNELGWDGLQRAKTLLSLEIVVLLAVGILVLVRLPIHWSLLLQFLWYSWLILLRLKDRKFLISQLIWIKLILIVLFFLHDLLHNNLEELGKFISFLVLLLQLVEETSQGLRPALVKLHELALSVQNLVVHLLQILLGESEGNNKSASFLSFCYLSESFRSNFVDELTQGLEIDVVLVVSTL